VPDTFTPEYLQSREVLRQWRIAQPLDRYATCGASSQKPA
jgi:hypothetical protein